MNIEPISLNAFVRCATSNWCWGFDIVIITPIIIVIIGQYFYAFIMTGGDWSCGGWRVESCEENEKKGEGQSNFMMLRFFKEQETKLETTQCEEGCKNTDTYKNRDNEKTAENIIFLVYLKVCVPFDT